MAMTVEQAGQLRGLSVIIPSKSSDNLSACIKAIRQHEPGLRIIVVDDGLPGSPDCVDGLALGLGLEDKIVMGQKPFVFAANANIGIEAAAPDDVILLNDDALLTTPGGFTAMRDEWLRSYGYGIIGAVTNLTGQPLQRPGGTDGIREVPHIAYICVLLPRRTLNSIGPLDERYCLDYGVEDRDHCEAATRAGLKIGVYDPCFVDHSKLTSTFRGRPESPRSFARNYELFKQKWGVYDQR